MKHNKNLGDLGVLGGGKNSFAPLRLCDSNLFSLRPLHLCGKKSFFSVFSVKPLRSLCENLFHPHPLAYGSRPLPEGRGKGMT